MHLNDHLKDSPPDNMNSHRPILNEQTFDVLIHYADSMSSYRDLALYGMNPLPFFSKRAVTTRPERVSVSMA